MDRVWRVYESKKTNLGQVVIPITIEKPETNLHQVGHCVGNSCHAKPVVFYPGKTV